MKSARAISSYSAARSIAFSDGGKSSGGDGSSRSKSTKRAGQSNTLKQVFKCE